MSQSGDQRSPRWGEKEGSPHVKPQRPKVDVAPPNQADRAGSAIVVIVMTRTVRDGPARPYACNLPEACDRLTSHSTQRTTAIGMGDYAHGHVSATNDNNGRDARTGESTTCIDCNSAGRRGRCPLVPAPLRACACIKASEPEPGLYIHA